MSRKIKSIVSIVIAVIMLCTGTVISNAKSYIDVYSEKITAEAGENIDIPVYIKNNTGIMGYKLIISYDKSVFTPVKVTQGTVLKGGMFNDSIDSSKNNEFAVLWCSTGNVTETGLIFTVSFKTNPEAKGKQNIKISYSKDDTFNEKWENIELKCENATVDFGGEEPTPEPTPTFFDKIIKFFQSIIDFIISLFK